MVSGAGTGYVACNGLQLTAWTPDRVEDGDGVFVYLHDLDDGLTWSLGAVPLGAAARTEAKYRPGVMKLASTRRGIESEAEICVAPLFYVKRSLEAGAPGYVLKDDITGVLEGVEKVLNGEIYVSKALR